ncbi:Metallothionein-2 like [Actinidia chinensis var. chinensis]|uniref:Metallothionein-2 like n=1 Tax=Actinidia chinensis var. chinensis TaxID=1590841 RepID=A0A2R6PEQ4_ACTCC|nr:Metallothionein-2 like [Actinidia chinensis var. chinensis]
MARVVQMAGLFVCTLLLLVVVVAEAAPKVPKPKKVKCHDKKNFPDCFQRKDLYCPVNCPRNCTVDCSSCQPVCTPPPPPPPSPPPPPPKQKKQRSPPPHSPRTPFPSPPPPPTNVPTLSPPLPPPPPHTPSPSPPPPPTSVPTLPPPPPPISVPTLSPPPPPSNVPTPPPSNLTPPPPTTPTSTPPLPPSPPSSTPSPEVSPKKVRCRNKNFEKCYLTEHTCPPGCPNQCEVDCATCSPVCGCNKAGSICQDPRFVGADGISFYFHGKKDRDFCIVSDSNLHINAHFIGRRNDNMKRDFTWIQSLGILFDTHSLFVGAKKTSTWDDFSDRLELAFDGQTISLPSREGAKWWPTTMSGVSVTRSLHVNSVVIEVEGNFKIKATVVPITEEDSKTHNYGITHENCFAHLDLGFKFYSLSGDVNGVLGQTYGSTYVSRVKMGVLMPVLGGDKEFASSTLFSTDCQVSKFSGHFNSSEGFEYGSLNCASGMDGQGVVCNR